MYSAAVALLMLFGACISTPTPQHVFIFGLGYTGLGLASTLTRFPGCVVSGTCRTDDKVKALNDLGIDAHVFDTDGSGQLDARGQRALALASHVVSMIPPVADFDRDPVLTAHRNFICDNPARWLAYVSTTGVYGDHQGAWVDEASPCPVAPGTAPHHRLAAEQAWLSLPTTRTCVFRLAGIYGPGRSALETVQRDRSPPTEGDATAAMALPGMNNWVSRVHVADICGAIVAAMLQPDTGGVFNVADDEPAPRALVMAYARTLLRPPQPPPLAADAGGERPLQAPPPPAETQESARSRRRRTDNKRVSNRRLRDVLGYPLRYPTYRDGLAAIHRGSTDPFTS